MDQKDTYPRTYPTIDITAQERVYLNLAANHAPASGNISTNHSCNTGGNLFYFQYNAEQGEIDKFLLRQNFRSK